MGLDIRGRSTGGHIRGGYSKLHYTVRYLALIYCGMPEYLDDNNEVTSMGFYMSPYLFDRKLNMDKLKSFIYVVQISGNLFPNILLHSDCDGKYTKNGKLDLDGHLLTGNSIALMKELEVLVNDPDLQIDKYLKQMEYTKAFYELVKKEISDGKGTIEFS